MRLRAPLVVISLLCACGEPEGDEPERPESPPVTASATSLTPVRSAALAVEDYLLNYGTWDAAELELAKNHQLVVVDADEAGVTRAMIEDLQLAGVRVLCYISIGEDQRTANKSDAQLAADPRFRGDGTGPRVDPRGPDADGESLSGVAPLGLPSPGGTGFASYYLDDNDHDGIPDENGNFAVRFTNAGDPAWFAALQDMTAAADRVCGLRELLTTTYGKGLGCDGLFLDTFDTAAPNHWTDEDSDNQTEFEWTAPGFGAFLTRLRAEYPDAIVLQNRGLFFFDPRNPQYDFIPRGQLDFVLYESFRLSSASWDNPSPYSYANNRYNYAPKLFAEAGRSDGFVPLSLGYAEGPADEMDERTLVGESTIGYASLLEDIHVAERLTGFRHYLTNSSVTLVNAFVFDHADRDDVEPPVWTSTYNDHNSYPEPPGAPTPRVGIQEVVASQGALTVRWDVALDLHRVGYALYYRTTPFDFAADPGLATAVRVVLDGRPPASYALGVGPGRYANEATIANLGEGVTYYLVIRAFDALGHEDQNQVVLTGTPTPAPTYLGRLRASNDDDTVTYRAFFDGTWTHQRVYIDRDRVTGTGWRANGIGADVLIEGTRVYEYAGNGTNWSWTYLERVSRTAGSEGGVGFVRWDLPISAIRHSGATRVVFQLQRGGTVRTSAPVDHVYTATNAPLIGAYVENDATRVYLHVETPDAYTYRHVFIDDDSDPATGYAFGGVGAGYLIENGSLYRHLGPGWSWTRVASAGQVTGGGAYDWSIARADAGAAAGAPRWTVVFQANGGGPAYAAPPHVHAFTP